MKISFVRVIMLVLFLALLTVGCLPFRPTQPEVNQPPIAHIDSVSATQVVPGETVAFSGHGIDPDGKVVAYRWRSGIDGELSTSQSFQTSSLSVGNHTIWFRVQDDKGEWSRETPCNVAVVPIGAIPPVINVFEASPCVSPGQPSILTWQVTGASTVKIEPNIGDVALTGSRTVSLSRSTIYTLIASNPAGMVTATAEVCIAAVPLRTVQAGAIAAESGQVRRDGYIGTEPNVGDTVNLASMQAFFSFDISMVPKGAKVTSVFLDLTAGGEVGYPFSVLGRLYVYPCQYTVLTKNSYASAISPGALFTTNGMFTAPVTSDLLVNTVRAAVDAGNPRFQIRLQFEKPYFNNRDDDYVTFVKSKPKLIIKYQD
ncbi:MAG: PKD domain-containing protein [Chloroflexi bacterium]|nr:PKD domain-containing protein [Chloroflexota bacterium]